jgi:hypothetical protein
MHRRKVRVVVAIIIAAAVVVAISASIAILLPRGAPNLPASFGAAKFGLVLPGMLGCSNLAGEVCYYLNVSCTLQGYLAVNLYFAVSNADWTTYPVVNNITLDARAVVTMLNGSATNGVWNFSMGNWSTLPSGILPTSSPFEVVFDTGLQSNSTLGGANFWVEHPGPDAGALGMAV